MSPPACRPTPSPPARLPHRRVTPSTTLLPRRASPSILLHRRIDPCLYCARKRPTSPRGTAAHRILLPCRAPQESTSPPRGARLPSPASGSFGPCREPPRVGQEFTCIQMEKKNREGCILDKKREFLVCPNRSSQSARRRNKEMSEMVVASPTGFGEMQVGNALRLYNNFISDFETKINLPEIAH